MAPTTPTQRDARSDLRLNNLRSAHLCPGRGNFHEFLLISMPKDLAAYVRDILHPLQPRNGRSPPTTAEIESEPATKFGQ